MNKLLVSLLVVFAVLLSGCDQLRSPSGVIGLAIQSIHAGHLAVFQTTLKDEALTRYGTEQGLAQLRAATAGMKLKIGRVWLKQSLLDHKDVRGTYIVRIRETRKNYEAAKLTVYCYYGKPPRGFEDIEPNWDRCWITQVTLEN